MTEFQMFDTVAVFHRAFGQTVAEIPTLPDAEVRALRQRLLVEERDELIEALERGDLVGVADALSDINYIASGTTDVYGIRPPQIVPVLHDQHDGLPPCFPDEELVDDARRMVEAAVEAVRVAEDVDHLGAISAALHAVFAATAFVAQVFHIPLRECFEEVHASNMSKLGEDGKPILREDGKFLKGPMYRKPNLGAILKRHGA